MTEVQSSIERSHGDLVEALGEVDLNVEGGESVEVGAVCALPCSPFLDRRRELSQSSVEFGELRLVAGDVFFEVGDPIFDVSALGTVGASADGAELVAFASAG